MSRRAAGWALGGRQKEGGWESVNDGLDAVERLRVYFKRRHAGNYKHAWSCSTEEYLGESLLENVGSGSSSVLCPERLYGLYGRTRSTTLRLQEPAGGCDCRSAGGGSVRSSERGKAVQRF